MLVSDGISHIRMDSIGKAMVVMQHQMPINTWTRTSDVKWQLDIRWSLGKTISSGWWRRLNRPQICQTSCTSSIRRWKSKTHCLPCNTPWSRRQQGSRSTVLLLFNLGAGWSSVVKTTPRALYSPAKPKYPLYRRKDGSHGWSRRFREILSPPPRGFDPRAVQPLTRHYNDYTIPVHPNIGIYSLFLSTKKMCCANFAPHTGCVKALACEFRAGWTRFLQAKCTLSRDLEITNCLWRFPATKWTSGEIWEGSTEMEDSLVFLPLWNMKDVSTA
jgi:hypothetical protein